MKYAELIKTNLKIYKLKRLGIEQSGIWKKNKRPYNHILPEPLKKLNILETYRKEFWEDYETGQLGHIKLHNHFHHLNSSQAMAFNLFFPFIYHDKRFLPLLLDSLNISFGEVTEAAFEKIKWPDEGTNFDFFFKYKSDTNVFFELKYSENEFGKAKNDASHLKKYEIIYRALLNNIMVSEFTSCEQFFENYQIIRNLIYIGRGNDNYCIFIFPERNNELKMKEDIILNTVLLKYRNKVKIIYLEQLVDKLIDIFNDKIHSKLITHFNLFKEKYIGEI